MVQEVDADVEKPIHVVVDRERARIMQADTMLS